MPAERARNHRARLRLILLLSLLLSACHNPIGEVYADVDAVTESESWQDWVIVGSFGPSGPFELMAVQSCAVSEPCHFSHEEQNHAYEEFYGYRLTILELQSPAGEITHIVLRSREKFPEETE